MRRVIQTILANYQTIIDARASEIFGCGVTAEMHKASAEINSTEKAMVAPNSLSFHSAASTRFFFPTPAAFLANTGFKNCPV